VPEENLAELFDFVVRAGCVLFVVLLALKGPTRVIKIAVATFALAFVVTLGLKSGWATSALVLGVILAANLASLFAAALLFREPLEKPLTPVESAACPVFARRTVEQWTRGFQGLGYEPCGDAQSHWALGRSKKNVFIRFLRHRSRNSWAEIHVLEDPRATARMISSVKEGGRAAGTVDRQANEEFFRDDRTFINRVASSASCADLVQSHEVFLLKVPGSLLSVEDPLGQSASTHDAWVERLLESRQVVRRGDSFAIPLRRALPTALRVLAAWFH